MSPPRPAKSRKLWVLFAVSGLLLVAALGVGVVLLLGHRAESFEVKTQRQDGGWTTNALLVEGINHGMCPVTEAWDADKARVATTYYHRQSPVGIVLERYNWFHGPDMTYAADARLPVSVIGQLAGAGLAGRWAAPLAAALPALQTEPPIGVIDLGVGTPASYLRPFQVMDFYESNAQIKALSLPAPPKGPTFTYVENALQRGAVVGIFDGPERKTLAARGPERFYKVLIVETSRGHPDRPAVERLTKEAMQLFMDKVADDGVVCYHCSSRNYELDRVVAALAEHLSLACVVGNDTIGAQGRGSPPYFTSSWVIVARDKKLLNFPTPPAPPPGAGRFRPLVPYWSVPIPDRSLVWTDAEQTLSRVARAH